MFMFHNVRYRYTLACHVGGWNLSAERHAILSLTTNSSFHTIELSNLNSNFSFKAVGSSTWLDPGACAIQRVPTALLFGIDVSSGNREGARRLRLRR